MKKTNSFLRLGYMWTILGMLYAIGLCRNFGGEIPSNPSEWLGEILVGMLLITGTVLIAVGRYLRDER